MPVVMENVVLPVYIKINVYIIYIYTFFYTCIHIHSELLLTRSACIDKLMLYHEQGYCCNIGRNL